MTCILMRTAFTWPIVYDNRDFPLNPSSGNISRIAFSQDVGLFESSNSWSNVSSEFTQYLNLGRSKFFKQQVLAMDLWTSYSITWDQPASGRGLTVCRVLPPFYDRLGAHGGDTRPRGFATNRFWDRAAVYGSVSSRVCLIWNPLGKIQILKSADIAWMQGGMGGVSRGGAGGRRIFPCAADPPQG